MVRTVGEEVGGVSLPANGLNSFARISYTGYVDIISINCFCLAAACFRVCADGGCNRLHDELPSLAPPPPPPPTSALSAAATEPLASASAAAAGTSAASPATAPATAPAAASCTPAATAAAAGAGAAATADPELALRLAHLPDLVLGDLDSLRPDTREFYTRHNVPFLDLSHDQVWLGLGVVRVGWSRVGWVWGCVAV